MLKMWRGTTLFFLLGTFAFSWVPTCGQGDGWVRDLRRVLQTVGADQMREVALLFPSEGCPCRYAALVDALKGPGMGGNTVLLFALAAPAPPNPEKGLGVRYIWNDGVRSLRQGFCQEKEALPFLVVMRAGPPPSILLAARVPEAPLRQRELARVVEALAKEGGERP